MDQLNLFAAHTTKKAPAPKVKPLVLVESELDLIYQKLQSYRASKSFKKSGCRTLHKWAIGQDITVMKDVLTSLQRFNNLMVRVPSRLQLLASKEQIYQRMLDRKLSELGEGA